MQDNPTVIKKVRCGERPRDQWNREASKESNLNDQLACNKFVKVLKWEKGSLFNKRVIYRLVLTEGKTPLHLSHPNYKIILK
jgi:hypothetical protein